jgi:hypothetical protein
MAAVGGARIRSGPQPDPNSLKSDRLKRGFRALPAEGYTGEPPRFPLPGPTVREKAVWEWAWTTPQAVAWAADGAWRADMVAEWVRMKCRAEKRDAPSTVSSEALRLRHQVGLTPAGLKENGWIIAAPEVAQPDQPTAAPTTSARARLRSVADVDGA